MLEASDVIQFFGQIIDLCGVAIIIVGIFISTGLFIVDWIQNSPAYRPYRQNMARVLLLGLEFLIAGDIVGSVAGKSTIQSITLLGVIVIIRFILSLEFKRDIDGYWLWQKKEK